MMVMKASEFKNCNYFALPGVIKRKPSDVKIPEGGKKELTKEEIRDIICDYFKVSWEKIQSGCRKRNIVRARHMLSYILYIDSRIGTEKIGEFIKRDHSTVCHATKTINGYIAINDEEPIKQLEDIRKEIYYKSIGLD